MRALTICLISILFIYIGFAGGQSKKPSLSLEERFEQLNLVYRNRPVVKFNGNQFRTFVKGAPRNYSMIVMFTALAPQRQCMICRHASDEYHIVSNSFKHSPSNSKKLYFSIVDFDEGSDVFQMMKLNTAPVFMHFPAKGKPQRADTMDISRVGVSAEEIARWIADRTDIQIHVIRPPNYLGTVAAIILCGLVAGFLYLRRNNLDFLYNKTMWGMTSLFFCFTMISGQMWNHIRGPPFLHQGQNGQIAYIHGSSQGQFVVETYIIMILNAAVVIGMILLTEAARGKRDPNKTKIMAVTGLILVSVFFSLLLSIFRTKTQGYPYRLLFN
ncbi:tumor suppressor candidate 3 [Coccinella septempunctata]|uniref:tumor suppressor candidate 3 n=1 Tax=Coccinella septempunctata TaxID=41139 RepID=UPI001D068E0D|nr:tumor suppressor candidate 3 [Coccinella septempunctata]